MTNLQILKANFKKAIKNRTNTFNQIEKFSKSHPCSNVGVINNAPNELHETANKEWVVIKLAEKALLLGGVNALKILNPKKHTAIDDGIKYALANLGQNMTLALKMTRDI